MDSSVNYAWKSNLPGAFRDSRLSDDDSLDFTIGSAYPWLLSSHRDYYVTTRGKAGEKSSGRAVLAGQLVGQRTYLGACQFPVNDRDKKTPVLTMEPTAWCFGLLDAPEGSSTMYIRRIGDGGIQLKRSGGCFNYAFRAGGQSCAAVAVHTAGSKPVNASTYAWGKVDAIGPVKVATEVKLPNGSWSTSQTSRADAGGNYTIPLTYGSSAPGTYRFRVRAEHQVGGEVYVQYSKEFTFVRTTPVTAATAGSAFVSSVARVWGTATGAPRGTKVWTEVWTNGGWSRSQSSTIDHSGNYAIPLTYGAGVPGRNRWRVGVAISGRNVYSKEFDFVRTLKPSTARISGVSLYGTPLVRGVVHYNFSGLRVQVKIDGHWKTVHSAKKSGKAGSGYSVELMLPSDDFVPGTYQWRVGAIVLGSHVAYSEPFTYTLPR